MDLDVLKVEQGAFEGLKSTRGLYLYGSPGCGKTFMMDLFYSHIEMEHKRRVHFHEFMMNIHKLNHKYYSQKLFDPTFNTAA